MLYHNIGTLVLF